MNKNFKNILNCIVALVLMIVPLAYSVHAVTITPPSAGDISSFNQILAPVMKIYNFVKYAASVLALLFIVFAAVQMFMNNNPSEKEQAKSKVMYIVIGLGLIWVAPIIVNYLTT